MKAALNGRSLLVYPIKPQENEDKWAKPTFGELSRA